MWARGAAETNSCGRFVAEIFLNLMNAFVFPGQGAQFPGMGKDLFDQSDLAKRRFAEANEVLGFDIASTMFEGTPKPSNKPTSPNRPSSSTRSSWPNAWGTIPTRHGGRTQPWRIQCACRSGVVELWRRTALVSARANAMQKPVNCNRPPWRLCLASTTSGGNHLQRHPRCRGGCQLQLPWTIGHFWRSPRRRGSLCRPFRGWRTPGLDVARGWRIPQPFDGACAGKTRPSH